jgi:hypothetical protein
MESWSDRDKAESRKQAMPRAGKANVDDYDPGPPYSVGGAARGGDHAAGVRMIAIFFNPDIARRGAGIGAFEQPVMAARPLLFKS